MEGGDQRDLRGGEEVLANLKRRRAEHGCQEHRESGVLYWVWGEALQLE
jgi:hypothetical protein